MTNTLEYLDYVVYVECKSLRARSKAEYLRQVRKIGAYHEGQALRAIVERKVFDYLIHLRDKQALHA